MSTYTSFKLETKMDNATIIEDILNSFNINFKKEKDDFHLKTNINGFQNVILSKKTGSYTIEGRHDSYFQNVTLGKIKVNNVNEFVDSIQTAYNVFKVQQDMVLKFGFSPVQNSLIVENGKMQVTLQREGI
jgi:hypothetical protein